MNFTLEKLKEARDAGIPDDVIWEVASETEPKFLELKQNNIPIDIAVEVFQGTSTPEQEPSGVLRQAADLPIQFAKGGLQGTRMFTDLLGAGNPISKQIAGGEEYLDALLSAESKKDSAESARILKAAEDKGVYDQVVAGLEALSKAPLETAFNVAGIAVPNLALGALGKVAQVGKGAITATQVGLGALQGAGSIKGQIYQAVQDELRSQGMDEETIHKTASEAQAYGGKNLDQILLGAGLGAAATRAEVILSRVISGAGKQVTDDVIKNTFKNGLFEAIPETFQGGQEQIAQNKALQNIGVNVPTMRGVVSASTMEGVAGGAFGGVAGLTESMSATPESISTKRNASPEAKAEAEIDRDSDIEAAKLAIPANDTNKILILDRVQQARQGIVNLQESLDVLEPTDPKAQGLRLDISAKQKELASLEAMAGLSVPITTIEEQQAALAGEIAAPSEPAAEPSRTGITQPAIATEEQVVTEREAAPVEQVVTPPVEVAQTIEEAAPVIGGKIESTGEVLARLATPKEKKGGKANQVGYNTIEPREGFEVVYKPYGENGAGYYYSPIQEKPIKEVVSRQLTAKEQEELTWAKGTIQAADSGIASAEASRDQAKRIIDKLEPITPELKVGKPISVQDAIQLVAGKTEKPGGVNPATWLKENDSLELRSVPLSEITPNQEGKKYDGTVNLERAIKYSKIPSDTMPPIILVEKKRNDDGLLNVLDGGHRVSAARMRGDNSILAIVRKKPFRVVTPTLEAATSPAPVTEQAAPAEAPALEVAPVAGDIQVANKPKAQQTISATSEAISKKEPLPQTRGKGTQYHGARGPIENLVEAYYSPDNIYGGEGTFYTTDALDIAAGYQRKKQSGVIYRVDEVTPVNFFNMEDRKPKTEWLSMFEGQGDFIEFAVERIYNDNPNLREIMDEMRAESANEGLTKDDVQEIFGSITYNLQQQGYGGMTHIGGLKTNREPHAVKIYFDPTNQISLSLEDVTKPSQKPTPAVSETITEPEAQPAPLTQPAGIAVGNRIRLGKSPQTYTIEEVISQSETEKANGEQYYSVKNEKTGETQVVEKADMKPVKKSADTRKTVVGDTQYQTEGVIPEAERFTEDELRVIVNDIFGGKIPDKIKIITDTTDPNKEFKAAYSIRKGTITYNLAYLAKGDDLNFVTNHELGHYILGDPKFQGEMARLFDSLPADIQEKLKKAIDEAYAQEGLGVRAEETIVFAFGEILENAPDGRNILQRFLDAIRDAINRLFKTEGYIPRNPKKAAAAILMAARNRFERGEFIKRPNGSILMMTPTSTKDLMRDAEYLAAVERGDMETAQKMVDKAAKAAGYDIEVYRGGSINTKLPWFTEDENEAAKYGATKKYFLKATNSIDVSGGFSETKLRNEGYDAVRFPNPMSKEGNYDGQQPQWVPFNPEQIKSADPVTYDDAGNVIPLSQRFQPSEPDIRRMAVKKGQVASIKNAGAEKKTPKQIIARTRELLRKDFFNPAEVTEQNTLTAFRALGKLVGPKKQAAAYAEELNDIGRLVDEEGVASEVSMGAILFTNDLFEYSIKLAAEGQKKMLGIMMSNMNKLPLGEGLSLEESARSMRGALERSTRFTMMGKAEQDAFANYVAEFIYGPNPSKEQIQSIKDAYAKVEKTPQVTEQELTDEIAAVGDRTGTDLVGKINEEFTKATEKGKEKRRTEEQELDREYKKVQRQADAEIEKLAKIQSDTPSFDPAVRQIINEVRAIVANDLKQRPDMESKADWKSALIAKLQQVGVELTAAETLADIVWRQHEINNLSRELSSINKAIEKGPISEIVKAIKDTPLEEQQKPNWRYEVMRDYLRKAGLNVAQSERIAKLMDISLQKRFTMAQEQAFTDAISKSAPWKTGDTRSRRAFQKVLQALRAGALDPARNVLSDMAALNGWTGFTPEQYKALLKYDAILANPETKQADLAEAHKAIQNIISKAKLPIRARDVIGQYYDAQALSGITTMTVNIFSPAGVAAKNALVQSLNGLVTARPEQITAAMTTFVDSIKSWANTVAYSFKNNVTVYSNVEYLVNDEGLLKLYNRGVDQFKNGKTPRERADGVKNMMIGMMDYVRRVLNALDYGAIASLQNQAVSKYALAAMQAKGMSSKDGAKMLNAMMEQKRIFYNDQIAIGTDKNKAAVLADEFFISAWRQALTDAKLPAQEVIDAALNDAMSAVGRNRQSLDAFLEEETNTRDQGLLSFPAIWLLETMANAANKQDSQFIKIFSRIIYGFAIVPARVLREAVWFSPLAAHRFAYEYIAEKKGLKSRYSQSLGNDLQYRQRLTETIAGSIVMLAFGAAMSASTDDEDDEKPFKIVVTGNGPLRNQDPQFHDSWVKKNRANTVNVYFGKTKFTLNTMRGFEAFAWPAMMLGAVDDWHIRRKQGRTTNTPLQMQDGAIVAGNILSASLRRGPYAFAAKPLFEAYGDRGVESLAKSLAFPAKTLVPVLGSSLAKNISDFLNEPMDRRTLEGALWSNVPFIGPTVAPKSLNAFGEPALATDAADKIFKLGVPIVFDIPNDRNSIMVHELVLKQGGGPSIPNRSQLAKRLDREPTNKEFEMFVKEYGAEIKRVMTENIEELSAMDGPDYDRAMEYIGNNARDMAQAELVESK